MNKVVLVTGGSSGIGRAIATYLSTKGLTVFGTSRNASNGQSLDNFTLVNMDVTKEDTVKSAVDYIIQSSGRLDILVNNAGLGMAGPLESTSDQETREIFDTNVFGLLNVCRTCIPHLRTQRGYIINITSIGGRVALPYRGIYCSSKFAVEGLTETLSMELRTFGIKVCLIEPGDFKTNINANRKISNNIDRSVYDSRVDTILAQIHDEVAGARDPLLIGEQVYAIIHDPSPNLRYKVATFKQKLSVTLKRFLPDRWFEKLIMRHYKL
jgi:NAD(P)-dependent dehydrogenase (short-subunit alcohol dehydrogenase family)